MEESDKRVENAVKALAAQVIAKFEKKKKIDSVQELIILATYLNMRRLDELRSQIDGVMRAFERLDALLDVVKQLRVAVENLQRGQSNETIQLLREVSTKLDEVLNKLTTYTVEEG